VKYLEQDFHQIGESPLTLACAYCSQSLLADFVGTRTTMRFYRSSAVEVRRIKAANRVFFETEAQAIAGGFHPPSAGV
jgi:hypothetical protein